jgi:hypothetical protein
MTYRKPTPPKGKTGNQPQESQPPQTRQPTITDQPELTKNNSKSIKEIRTQKQPQNTKAIPTHGAKKMALTFGTLLSSQRTNTHHHEPFGPIRGNPQNTTRPDTRSQTTTTPDPNHQSVPA